MLSINGQLWRELIVSLCSISAPLALQTRAANHVTSLRAFWEEPVNSSKGTYEGCGPGVSHAAPIGPRDLASGR